MADDRHSAGSDQGSRRSGGILSATVLFHGLSALVALLLLVQVDKLVDKPVALFGEAPAGLAPDFFPRLVLGAWFVVSLWQMLAERSAPDAGAPRPPSFAVWVTGAASLLFALLLEPLGFVLASSLVVTGLAVYLGGRSAVAIVAAAILIPVAVYAIFTRLLHISLPAGVLGV